MSQANKQTIEDTLKGIIDDNLGADLLSAGCVQDIQLENGIARVKLELGYPARGAEDDLISKVRNEVDKLEGINSTEVSLGWKIVSHAVQKGVKPLANVKNTIAVASGKGGVGKSTTAVNLALALQAEGAKVGILDADIYGPSQPRMLGCHKKPDSPDGKTLTPNLSYGIQSMSIGYLIDEETPMIWRGPMVTSALEQLLTDTNWDDLDYLVIDLPPGTGDIQLTLCQKVPVSGAVIVTTPQDIALLDARKALRMFEKVDVSVLGIVENMSTHICSQCGHEEHIFGSGGGASMAKQYEVDLLGSLPLDIQIREGVDNGKPTVAIAPDSEAARCYRAIARMATGRLAMKARDYSHKFPKIVVENT